MQKPGSGLHMTNFVLKKFHPFQNANVSFSQSSNFGFILTATV